MTDLFWSFAPWMVFLITGRVTSFWPAVIAGGIAAAVVLGRAVMRHRVHLLDAVAVAYFVALTAAIVVIQPTDLDEWSRFAQAGSHAVLTVVIFASVIIGRPFTASYARDTTPEIYWHTAEFRAINRQISSAWGLAFLVGTISLVIAGETDVRQALLRVVIPFGSLAWAYKYTQERIGQSHEPQADPAVNGALTSAAPSEVPAQHVDTQ